ncbi:MAG: PDZ domain-containing protein [Planctomycetota bacterium]|nr:PDZ domain-containing protein [Planctomycetota bacterium]
MGERRTMRYQVSLREPEKHFAEASLETFLKAGETTLVMPVWTPGSYKVRDFAKHVREITVHDSDGQSLPFKKIRKNAWTLQVPADSVVHISYRVYGFEFSVRTNHIDDGHAFLNCPNTFLYVEGEQDRDYDISVTPPEGWDLECALPPGSEVQAPTRSFHANNYDVLADSPFFLGSFTRHNFDAGGIPHEIVLYGEGNRDASEWIEPFQKIIKAEVDLFGDNPVKDRYVFIVYLLATGAGGLEHRDSSVIQFAANNLRKQKDWNRFLSLIAHEYFHLWNGKRIRPENFEPFDFDKEVYTRSLWVVEGITAYYDEVILRHAGLISDKDYLALTLDHIKRLKKNPGRFHDSLEDASYDAWIKLYQRDEHTINTSTSYYEKGQQVALCLDLKMRAMTGGKVSLNDVVRSLWQEHKASDGAPYAEGRIEKIASDLVGESLDDFFNDYVRGTIDIDWNLFLEPFGLKFVARESGSKPDLGAFLKGGSKVVFESVLEGGAASEAGFSARDEIVAVNGQKVTKDNFEDRIRDNKPGDVLSLHFFRNGLLRELPITPRGTIEYTLIGVAEPTDEQKALYEGWLRSPWGNA